MSAAMPKRLPEDYDYSSLREVVEAVTEDSKEIVYKHFYGTSLEDASLTLSASSKATHSLFASDTSGIVVECTAQRQTKGSGAAWHACRTAHLRFCLLALCQRYSGVCRSARPQTML